MSNLRFITVVCCLATALGMFVSSVQKVEAVPDVQTINIKPLIKHENSLGLAYNPDANVLYLSEGSGPNYGHIITIDMNGNLLHDMDLQAVYRSGSWVRSLSYDRTTSHLFVLTHVLEDRFATLVEMSVDGSTIYNRFPLPLDGGVGITFRDGGVWRANYTQLDHYTRSGVLDRSIPFSSDISRIAGVGPIASSVNGGFFISDEEKLRLIEVDRTGNKAGVISTATYGRGMATAMDSDLASKRIFISVNNETIYILPLVTQIKSTVTIVKESQPKSTQDFVYYGPWGKFNLDNAMPDDGDAVPNSVFYRVNPGTYNFAEGLFPSWYLADIRCTGTGQFIKNLAQRSVSFTVNYADEMTCTFVTQRRVNLQATQFNDLNGDGIRQANEPALTPWEFRFYKSDGTLINHKVTDANGSAVQNNVIPGSFKVCETQQSGWTNTLPGQLDPQLGLPCYNFTLQPGQNASLLFGNTQKPIIRSANKIDPSAGLDISELSDINEPESDMSIEEADTPIRQLFLPIVSSQ